MSEGWVESHMYCPRCGHSTLEPFVGDKPVADFFCPKCKNQYELKSKSKKFGGKITDGAYKTMIDRITSSTNPDLLLLSYEPQDQKILSLAVVPKHFYPGDYTGK